MLLQVERMLLGVGLLGVRGGEQLPEALELLRVHLASLWILLVVLQVLI